MSNNSTGYFPLTKVFSSDTPEGLEEKINSWLLIYRQEYKPSSVDIKYNVASVFDSENIVSVYSALLKLEFYNTASMERMKNGESLAEDGGFWYDDTMFDPPST